MKTHTEKGFTRVVKFPIARGARQGAIGNSTTGFTLIEILVVIGIIAILAAIVLIAINPAKQFADANDTQRNANVNAILNAVGQYMVDNNGQLPTGVSTTTNAVISSAGVGTPFCNDLVPDFIPALPVDPTASSTGAMADGQISETECGNYNTEYHISVATSSRVTISAPNTQGDGGDISVTR